MSQEKLEDLQIVKYRTTVVSKPGNLLTEVFEKLLYEPTDVLSMCQEYDVRMASALFIYTDVLASEVASYMG